MFNPVAAAAQPPAGGAAAADAPRAVLALPVARIANAPVAGVPPQRAPLLDLDVAEIAPWDGSGSCMAVRAQTVDGDWRVKSTGDSGCSAMEVTMARLFRMTGLRAPEIQAARHCEALPGDSLNVASRFESGFQDLGGFLLTPRSQALAAAANPLAEQRYLEQRARHATAVSGCDTVLQRAGVERFWQLQRPDLIAEHAAWDRRRFDALEAMNRLLPTSLRADQVRHFIASRWLDNWDHLNYRMENFGYVVSDAGCTGMTVDFGSCGPLGFRHPGSGELLSKQRSRDIALAQRPPSLFPIPDAFAANRQGFDAMDAASGALHDTLRWPYGFQSDSVAEMMRPPALPEPQITDAIVEMGYRLALLPDAAIATVVARNWQTPAGAAAAAWPDAASMARQLSERRNSILQGYDHEQMHAWLTADPQRAAEVRQQVIDALTVSLGEEACVLEAQRAVQAAHDALASSPLLARAAAVEPGAANASSRDIRSLQSLHACNQRLAAALASGDADAIAASVQELMSAGVLGELLENLAQGPGSEARARAPFTANQSWLVLMRRLVEEGHVSPTQVVNGLLASAEYKQHLPSIGIFSHQHPALGTAFINLLEGMMAGEQKISAHDLREALLTGKAAGVPNFYSALMASNASSAWQGRLKDADLWPSSAEVVQHRSLLSLATMKMRELKHRDDAPIELTEQDQALVGMHLEQVVHHIAAAYAPDQVLTLELPIMRENIYPKMKFTTNDERAEINSMVERAVKQAWRDALEAHPGMKSTPLPPALLTTQQQQAVKEYEASMKTLRRADAEQIIVQGEQDYRDAVLADPGMSLEERRSLRVRTIETTVERIADRVKQHAQAGKASGSPARLHEQVRQDVSAEVTRLADAARAEAQQAAEASARAQAERQTVHVVQGRVRESARRDIMDTAAAAAALVAQQKAQAAARQQATERAGQKAAETAKLNAALRESAQNSEIATRLALLRAPDVHARAASSSASVSEMESRLRGLRDSPVTPSHSSSAATARSNPDQRSRTAISIDPATGRQGSQTR